MFTLKITSNKVAWLALVISVVNVIIMIAMYNSLMNYFESLFIL